MSTEYIDDESLVRKNDYGFSFAKTVFDLVGNSQLKKQQYNVLCTDINDCNTDIWRTLSSIGQEFGSKFNENIANFIDNVANIELCKVRNLESISQMLGISYTVFQNIQSFPIEVLDMLDVFSIKREYLIDCEKIDKKLTQFLSTGILETCSSTDEVAKQLSSYRKNIAELSNDLSNIWNVNVKSQKAINDAKLDSIISATYFTLLQNKLCQTYNDKNNTVIYKVLSNNILLSNFNLPNSYKDQINDLKLTYNLQNNFDEEEETDKIDNLQTSLDQYSQYEQQVLELEIKRRQQAYDSLQSQTKYKYYREKNVQNYFKFIENQYTELSNLYENSIQYKVDPTYIQIENNSKKYSLLNANGTTLNYAMIESIANTLLAITNSIRDIREYVKAQIQKNFMRGSYLLMQYMINEYLKNTVVPNINLMQIDSARTAKKISVVFDPIKTTNELIEYSDNTQYYNISTEVDALSDKCNDRYWEEANEQVTEYPKDNTNLFELHSILNSRNFIFSLSEIEKFYKKILKNRFDLSNPTTQKSKKQSQFLAHFLSSLFDVGADSTYMDENGVIQTPIFNTVSSYNSSGKLLLSTDFKIQPKYNTELAESISAAIAPLSVYYFDSWKSILSGSIQSQILQLSNCFSEDRQYVFSQNKEQIADSVESKLTSDVNAQIQSVSDTLRTTFEQLTSMYRYSVYVSLTNPYLKQNIESYMLCIQILYDNFPMSADVLTEISSSVENISSQYDIAYSQNKDKKSEYLNSVAFNGISVYEGKIDCSADTCSKPETEKEYLEQLAQTYTDVQLNNEIKLNSYASQYNSYVSQSIQTYDNNWSTLKTFSAEVSTYLSDETQIEGLPISVLNDLSTYADILEEKTELFYKYSGLSVCDMPYMNIQNKRHPSYQIHPCLNNFAEIDDAIYPIQNTVALVDENLESFISGYVNEYFDKDGYAINIWKNPLNINSDYQSNYEAANHTNSMNNEDPMYGYDGLFYPEILNTFLTKKNKFINAVKKNQNIKINSYRGLNLRDAEAKFIASQLEEFYEIIRIEAKQKFHDIYRFGQDLYGNQYILVKNYSDVNSIEQLLSIDEQTRKNTPGILWVKVKNHPIAFPAFALKYDYTSMAYSTLSTSNIYVDSLDNDINLAFVDCNTVKIASIYGTEIYSPGILDFTISKGKTILIANANTKSSQSWPILAKVSKKYNEQLDRNVCLLLNDVKDGNYIDCLIDYETLKSSYSGYKFMNYFNIGLYPGVMYYKENISDSKISYSFDGVWYDYGVNAAYDACRNNIASGNDIRIDSELARTENTETCFDICKSSKYKNSCLIKMAYLTDKIDKTQLSNYQHVTIANYSDMSQWIDTPENCIVTKDIDVFKDSIVLADDSTRLYLPYSDHGFNPLHEKVENNTADTQLPYHLFDKRGILKYQMIGANKPYGIDFKYVIPIRMFDPYTVSSDPRYNGTTPGMTYDKLSAADYMMQHFDESILSSGCQLIDVDGSIYSLYEFKQKFKNYKLQLRVDEEYISFMKQRGFDPRDPDVDYTYLWRKNAGNGTENNIPDKYIYAYDPTYNCLQNEYDLNLFENKDGYHHLSISWYIANDSIGIDVNSYYYTQRDDKNVFNRKHKFASMPKSGDAAVLYEWKYSETEDDKLLAKYYIKNISDDKPKFLISAWYDSGAKFQNHNIVPEENDGFDKFVVEFDDSNFNLVTEDGTKITDEEDE